MKIAIISINDISFKAALKLASFLKNHDVKIYKKDRDFIKLDDILKDIWEKSEALIFIMAIGAVVRKVASLLKNKSEDPAVLVMTLDLLKVVPLLGGHLGGANELSVEICKKIKGCIPFITTATDQMDVLSFDMFAKERGFLIENLFRLSKISNALLNGKEIEVATYENIFKSIEKKDNLKLIPFERVDENSVLISPFSNPLKPLTLKPPLFIGIGCNRGVCREKIKRAFLIFLEKYSLKREQIKALASFEAKKSEKGLLEFAEEFKLEIKFFDKESINSLESDFSRSFAKKYFDIKGVAEPSAVLASRYRELVIKKESFFKEITIAGAV